MNAPSAFVGSVIDVIQDVLYLYIWLLIIGAVLSWLVAFGVINKSNRVVDMTIEFVRRMTEPLLAPIRRKLPKTGDFDLSPLVLILILIFVQHFLWRLAI
jgi:YggT family protein